MSRVDRSAGVDFEFSSADSAADADSAVDAHSAADEVLVEPPDRAPWFSRRTRFVLTVVAAIAVVTILVVQAVSSGSSAPTASPRATVTVPPSVAPVPQPLRSADRASVPPAVASTGPAACPKAADGVSLCSTSDLVPAAALNAVRHHFPGATIESKVEEDLRDIGYGPSGPWFREIRARLGRAAILVQVRRRSPHDRSRGFSSEDGSRAVVVDQLVTFGLTVIVRITTVVGRLPRFGPVQALARDER